MSNSRMDLARWIAIERARYADVKYPESSIQRDALKRDVGTNPHLDGEWGVFVGNYLRRAELLGLDSPQGRQALGKTIVTLMHLLETAIDVCGPMPRAGVPSGEIIDA